MLAVAAGPELDSENSRDDVASSVRTVSQDGTAVALRGVRSDDGGMHSSQAGLESPRLQTD